MNRQPYQTPPKHWPPLMTPWIVKLWRPLINRELRRGQKITKIEVQGIEHPQQALRENCGLMVTPNHSFHYDSYVMIETAHRVGQPFHFLSAWQVFAMSKPLEQRVLQWHGCFSINREAADLKAFKQAVDILQTSQQPLVVFPEGDIYHSNDRVTPFRDGAAAIAMSAAKKSERKIVVQPCALKCFYVTDPAQELAQVMTRLEQRFNWRPRTEWPLDKRIFAYADGLLSLKEIEYIGRQQSGTIPERIQGLANHVLAKLEQAYGVANAGGIVPERVKEVRRAVIKQLENPETKDDARQPLVDAMDDLFFVVQLFSYPGNYLAEKVTIERTAETLDKFEEDVLEQPFPGIRGERHAIVRFGPPIEVPKTRDQRDAVARMTDQLEHAVQGLLDEINAQRSSKFAV
ncbi:1-acyl-sn-glycerol-3-phosphate acyltransferase [Anatilimnocola sp. NA78]|uniref:lysophospholipid acyltransferase family protein n=1 Tax=Anatilimnocola sp. NA78 TaxID=3415683 RepID=UPI003CE484B4